MDSPYLLLVLLALPIATAAVIVAVSLGRRRSRPTPGDPATEPVHRLQTDTAAAQDSVDRPAPAAPKAASARLRRAATAKQDER